MFTSRVRQFNKVRQKNLSQTYSHAGQAPVYRHSITNNANSFMNNSSNFLKKKKDPICIKCVNKKMANQKQEKIIKQRVQQLRQTQQLIQQSKSIKMQANQVKNKSKIQALQYNLNASQQNIQKLQYEKFCDKIYMKNACDLQRQSILKQQQQRRQNQIKQENYRRQLLKQYQGQLAKKKYQKTLKTKTQPDNCIIKGYDVSQIKKKYAQQLKQQMIQQKFRRQIQKQSQVQKDRSIIQKSEKDFFNYSQSSQRGAKSNINPQIFQQMKQLQKNKIAQKKEIREAKERQRKQKLIKAKEQLKEMTQKKLLRVKSYASALNVQIKAKKTQQQKIMHQQKESKCTEDILKCYTSFKPCNQCSVVVKQTTLSYYGQ